MIAPLQAPQASGDLMIARRTALLLLAVSAVAGGVMPAIAEELQLPREKIELVAPPLVHPHEQATLAGPKIVEFSLVAEEKKLTIDDQDAQAVIRRAILTP
jgi:nitrite reductase (NO-forming)